MEKEKKKKNLIFSKTILTKLKGGIYIYIFYLLLGGHSYSITHL